MVDSNDNAQRILNHAKRSETEPGNSVLSISAFGLEALADAGLGIVINRMDGAVTSVEFVEFTGEYIDE